jgi:hypothetical protein
MSNESEKPDMEELDSICCIGCGADTNLYINHQINQCSGEQITCLPCALIWQKNGGSW